MIEYQISTINSPVGNNWAVLDNKLKVLSTHSSFSAAYDEWERLEQALIEVQTPKCQVCGVNSKMSVDITSYKSWVNGTLIQKAFPNLSSDERELLMTGTHSACWESMFKSDEME